MEGINNPGKGKEYYEDKLWKKAEELSVLRTKLQAEADMLFDKVKRKDVGAVGLYAEELLRELEGRYFEVLAEVEEVKNQENQLQQTLEDVTGGKIDEKLITTIVGENAGPKLSKRKQRIFEERKTMGVDPRSGDVAGDPFGLKVDTYIVKQQGVGANRLTTGRHLKGLKGDFGLNPNLKEVERKFFEATKDSHGGKVSYGKKGDQYVSGSGKRIRKF